MITKNDTIVGDVVCWDNDPFDNGIVTDVTPNGVRIKWGDDQHGWIDWRDTENVSHLDRGQFYTD